MTSTEKVKAGFETSTGADQYITYPNSYNDGKRNYAVVTFGGSTIALYVDGSTGWYKINAWRFT